MKISELNTLYPPLLPLCSEALVRRDAVEDETLKMSYEIFLPCGNSRERAIARFRALQQNPGGTRWMNDLTARLSQNLSPLPRQTQPSETRRPETSWGAALASVLSLGILGGEWGCAPARFPEPGGVLEKGNVRLRVDLAGDPGVGEILFIRQLHFPPSRFFNPRELRELRPMLLGVGLYQAEILRTLKTLEPKHLFVEGLGKDFPPEQHRELQWMMQEAVELLDQENHEEIRREKEILLLGYIGAASVYAALRPDVWLHKTMNAQESELYEQKLEEMRRTHASGENPLENTEIEHWILEERESWATREMTQFFRQQPGATAVLIFGLNHSFCDDFLREGFVPRLTSLWWEGLHPDLHPNEIPAACP